MLRKVSLSIVLLLLSFAPLLGQTGDLQVFVSTSGANLDSDGYVVALDDISQSVSVNGSVAFARLSAGSYTASLIDVAENCTVQGANPRTVVIAANGVAEIRFEIVCGEGQLVVAPDDPQPSSSTQRKTRNNRAGLWGGFGFGGGNLGCLASGCGDRIWGFSGNARLGGTPSQYVRLAGGTNGFWREEDGVTLQGGTVTFQVLWFPSARDFFLIFGAGFASFQAEVFGFSQTENGAGFLIGLGYDAPISKSGNLAITPFLNWLPTTVGNTIDYFQVGVGLTFN